MPFIDSQFIEDLQLNADIVDIIGKRVSLKKTGANYKACCPFHDEKTPSFVVSSVKQIFNCFGCGQKGGVLKFISQYENLDFVAAVEALAKEVGIDVVYEQKNDAFMQKQQQNKKYQEIMLVITKNYERQLREHSVKAKVVDYLLARKITGITAKKFALGFAPPERNLLLDEFKSDAQILLTLGVFGKNDNSNDYYQRFRDRLIFPIHNSKGDVVGFGARALGNNIKPKYLNSPETPIFSKSKELYGLYHCRKYSKNMDYVLVVEGYMDVISLHQKGITQAVATLGTATSETHLDILAKSTRKIVFCFDGDEAGKKAAHRALEISLAWLKEGMRINFLFLPDGEDPDSLVQKEGKKSFIQRIDEAINMSDYLFTSIKNKVDFNSPEAYSEFVENSLKHIIKVQYNIYKQQLLLKLSELSNTSIEQIKEEFNIKQAQLNKKTYKKIVNKPVNKQVDDDYEPSADEVMTNFHSDVNFNNTPVNPINTQIANKQEPVFIKAIAKIILLLANYPNIVDEIGNKELKVIKEFDNTGLLYEVISSLQVDEVFDEIIIKYKTQEFYAELRNILQGQLIINNEIAAKNELITTISGLNMHKLKQEIAIIRKKTNKTPVEEKTLIDLIVKLKNFKI